MNALKYRGFRYFAIAALLAIGISTTIATGGGGSGSSESPTQPPTQPPSGATLNITAANGLDVAAAVVTAIGISFDLGDITGGNIAVASGDIQLSAPGKTGPTDFYKSLLQGIKQAPENCVNG
jgi:hypothetical protein